MRSPTRARAATIRAAPRCTSRSSPATHQGRTPPCVDALIDGRHRARRRGDARPESAQQAHGGERLRAAGIDVDVRPAASDEARELNIGFVSRMTRGRPWVRVKMAASLDGRTALAKRREPVDHRRGGARRRPRVARARLRDPHRRRHGAAGRSRSSPCARSTTPRQPLRVVVDRHGQTPPSARVLAGGNALIVTAGERNAAWPAGRAKSLALPDAQRPRRSAGADARTGATRGINELHVEAGAKLNGALLDGGLDRRTAALPRARRCSAIRRAACSSARRRCARSRTRTPLAWHSVERVGADLRVIARVHRGGGALMFTGIVQAVGRIAATIAGRAMACALAVDAGAFRHRRRRGRRQRRASTAAASPSVAIARRDARVRRLGGDAALHDGPRRPRRRQPRDGAAPRRPRWAAT